MYIKIYILLLLGVRSLPVYSANKELNLSASCPRRSCSLWWMYEDRSEPLRYLGEPAVQLEELLFINCWIRSLPVELLRLTPNLRNLQVFNSSIYRMPTKDWSLLPKLQQLTFEHQRMVRLDKDHFKGLQQLELLQLGDNILVNVHMNAFAGLKHLKLLALPSNSIKEIFHQTFDELVELTHLDLSHNKLTSIGGEWFEHNSKLQTLLLNDNELESEHLLLPALPQLRLLDISNCGDLTELQLNSAHTVIVERSNVQRLIIHGSVIKLQGGNNALTQLSIGDKSAVIELDLHNNLLDSNITSALLTDMWQLRHLDLSSNNIETLTINSSISLHLPSLRYLNLAHNKLRALPPALPMLPSGLLHLDISYNHLLQLQARNFAALPNLEHLNIAGNRLAKFDIREFYPQHAVVLKEMVVCGADVSAGVIIDMRIYFIDMEGGKLITNCNSTEQKPKQLPFEVSGSLYLSLSGASD
ncbi:leucine-rich repeat transmembrane neuronal protein 3-like [Drosophila busckii]|uniref:leucine-rich repeat transmembrane neuronal protein 3-like n=1 Tax=Drosophila busckii TaxID=30019 RepID=UPI0014329FC1|nr:leucine-rich repeat transmembrane neuronal protein 3-like [Drosophila busckii]